MVFGLPVGRRPLFNQDEARFALLAREGAEHGHWVLPRVRDVIYMNKPPLYFWTVAVLALPFGVVDETTAPVASVVSALLTLLAVVAIGRRLWRVEIGLGAGMVLASAPFFYFMSHQVVSDMMLTAWLAWALYFLLSARISPVPRRPLIAFYLCLAGALATKGPAALMGLAAALAVVLVEDGRRGLRWLRLPLGVGILAVSTLPWLLPYLLQTERSYVGNVVAMQYGQWYFREKRHSRIIQLLDNLGRGLPWTLFLGAGFWWWWHDSDPRRRALLVWTVVIAVAVSFSGEQRARYFLPALPPLAVLIAELLVRAPQSETPRARRLILASYALLLLAAATVLALLLGSTAAAGMRAADSFVPAAGWQTWVTGLLLVGGLVAAVVVIGRGGSGLTALTVLSIALGGILLVEGWGYPMRYAEQTNIRGFTAAMAARLPTQGRVLAYPDAVLSYDFYLRRPVRELSGPAELADVLDRPRPGDVLLMREAGWAAVRPQAEGRWQVLLADRVGRDRVLLLAPRS